MGALHGLERPERTLFFSKLVLLRLSGARLAGLMIRPVRSFANPALEDLDLVVLEGRVVEEVAQLFALVIVRVARWRHASLVLPQLMATPIAGERALSPAATGR